jgi:hypothetical protein
MRQQRHFGLRVHRQLRPCNLLLHLQAWHNTVWHILCWHIFAYYSLANHAQANHRKTDWKTDHSDPIKISNCSNHSQTHQQTYDSQTHQQAYWQPDQVPDSNSY